MEVTPKAERGKPVCSSPGDSVQSSPAEHRKQEKPHQRLSSSLKERLKRSRRSFTSPFSVAKRLCVDDAEDGGRQVSADARETANNPALAPLNRNDAGSERFSGPSPEPTRLPAQGAAQPRNQLKREVRDKTETLRRLKMVQMYRSKNDLTQLQTLIDKWRSCAQAALCELQSDVLMDGQKAGLSDLIDLFGLDAALLHFDRTEGDFK